MRQEPGPHCFGVYALSLVTPCHCKLTEYSEAMYEAQRNINTAVTASDYTPEPPDPTIPQSIAPFHPSSSSIHTH